MIWLGLILLLQYFILNHLFSMFTYVRFQYAIFIMVMIYLRINLKLKLLFFSSEGGLVEEDAAVVMEEWGRLGERGARAHGAGFVR
jgi:hypothetical protein